MAQATVAIVIPCFNQARYLRKAIESALGQTVTAGEVIVVNDGSSDDTPAVAASFPRVRFVGQPNRGRSAAKNRGLKTATAEKIIFLDADDVLQPNAIAAGLECFSSNPGAAFVYGAFANVTRNSRETEFQPVSTHRELVQTNWIGMIAAVMFDRDKLLDCGGFDEGLGMCEDWDLFLRMSRKFPFASHRDVVADYVRHGANATNDVPELRKWIDVVRSKEWERGLDADGRKAWSEGEAIWRTRVPDPVRRSAVGAAARNAARALLRPLRK